MIALGNRSATATAGRDGSPGEVLTHPLAILALVLLVFNDHVLKVHHPSWLTGKLSDLAVLLLVPLWASELFQWAARSLLGGSRRFDERRVLFVSIVVVGAFFASMELTWVGDAAYRYGLGFAQWPFRCVASWLWAGNRVEFRPVVATPDPTDLLTLPMLFAAWWLGKRYAHPLIDHVGAHRA